MAATQYLPVASIRRREDARPVDDQTVDFLVESIEEVGQITPILVRPVGDGFEVIAGSHRLAAFVRMGEADILAVFAEHDDDLHAELAMIDENLCRRDLSPVESAAQLARRKAIYEELYPGTRHGSPGVSRQVGDSSKRNDNNEVARFTANAAAATGRSERAVQRDTERGEKVIPEVLATLKGTKRDTGAYLDKLKKLPPNDQVHAARRDLAMDAKADRAEKTSNQKAKARATAKDASGPDYERFVSVLDGLDGLDVKAILRDCPPRKRAALCQRASSAIDLLSEVMEGASQ
jgi:ParB-like chromosome segregation protein Spo0J